MSPAASRFRPGDRAASGLLPGFAGDGAAALAGQP